MRFPTKENWGYFRQHGLTFCLGYWPSTNPRFYKYSWQIWAPECELEGEDFFVRGDHMSTASFAELFKKMHAENQSGWIYSRKRPRLGIDTPFNKNHHRWREVEFAISWDDDPDPIWNGHK